MMLYHRTQDAHSLVKEGFQDTDISNVVGVNWSGLWLCEAEYSFQDYLYGAEVISFDIPEDIVQEYEDKPILEVERILADLACRHFLVPASILNQYPPTTRPRRIQLKAELLAHQPHTGCCLRETWNHSDLKFLSRI